MTTMISQVGGTPLEYPGSLERFEEPDTNDGVASVPFTAQTASPQLVALTGADIIEAFNVRFRFIGTLNAYTGTDNPSPWFPYNFVQSLKVPYQSGSMTIGAMDGHLWWLTNVLRGRNRKYDAPYIAQVPLLSTGYAPQPNLSSAANYAIAPSVQKVYEFNFDIDPALYFDRYYDVAQDGKLLRFDDCFVSPLLMSSTGRNIIPSVLLNPFAAGTGGTLDTNVSVMTGTQTTLPTWTDNGSQMWWRRRGWRQPADVGRNPLLFNWVHNWFSSRYSFAGGAKLNFNLPTEGQLLTIVCRLFDPTLASGIGGPIVVNGASNVGSPLRVTYGSGLNKFADTPRTMQDRFFRQHGFALTEGLVIWDMYADTMSNVDAINTYNTASPQVTLDFTGATPGAGSYCDVMLEYLTQIGA